MHRSKQGAGEDLRGSKQGPGEDLHGSKQASGEELYDSKQVPDRSSGSGTWNLVGNE